MSEKQLKPLSFVNPEPVSEQEIIKIFQEFPIDFIRVRDFLFKEPGIREAFLQYTGTYINTFADTIGMELRPVVYAKLQEILLTCLTVGYLTRENFFRSKLKESFKEGEKDASSTD